MFALNSNTTGGNNTAIGYTALYDLNITDGTGNNTALGYNTGLGIVTGINNTILGANVTVLDAALSNNIIIANGTGAIKAQNDGTDWKMTGIVEAAQVKLTTGAGSGLVLTSDVAGLATWQTPAGGWALTGNAGTTRGTNFIGTTDNVDVVFKRNGQLAGLLNNWASNTAFGVNAFNLTSTGHKNTANGAQALYSNTAGDFNTANGYQALFSNITGSNNTANGNQALFSNTTGYFNTANGDGALLNTTTGSNNTANGNQALFLNTTGSYNTANGNQALFGNTTGSYNTALGVSSDINKTTGDNCLALGYNASTGANSNYVQIGDINITSIGGQVAWTNRSDKRIKEHLKENVPGLDFITKLKPISYNFNLEKQDSITGVKADTSAAGVASRKKAEAIIHTGFAAQDVESALKSLGYDFDGLVKPQNTTDLYSLSYSLFTVPLVKAVQEQQVTITAQQQQIQSQQQQIDELRKMVEALAKKK